ncbi:MAG: sulfotransferase [Sphingomonas bacterium]|nr:sulfotransferase [Sphingomonas bacterium]
MTPLAAAGAGDPSACALPGDDVDRDPPSPGTVRAPAEPPAATRVARVTSAGLTRLWRSGILPEPTLDPAALIERAVRAERKEDFGPDHWRGALEVLTGSLAAEADLNPIGRTLAHGQLVKILRERLRAHALWRAHPEILERPIPAPIIVLGSMRSGTTRIQRLLACDDRLAHTRLFESLTPVPARLRRGKAAAGLAFLRALNPPFAAIHPTAASAPDEEFGLFGFSVNGAQLETQWRVPGFARWWEGQDPAPVYREFRRLLQTIGWSRGEAPGRPWILKSPQYMEELDAMIAAFPDARLICLHRDPAAVVASSASLVWHQLRVQSDSVSAAWVGGEWLGKTARRVERAAAARRRHPDVPQIDVQFADVDRDWLAEMRRIYAFLGMALTPAVEARMRHYLGGARAHLGHRYTLDAFGLSDADVARALPNGA